MPYGSNITISKDGSEATIPEASWPVYERNGWTRADDGSSEEPQEETEAPAKKTTTRKAD
jgi:hypothetical protein